MPDISMVKELLYWSYANLGMAHIALQQGKTEYGRLHYGMRKRLYSGFMDGTRNIRDLLHDEKLKMKLPQACCYCGSKDNLSVDHMIPKMKGGQGICLASNLAPYRTVIPAKAGMTGRTDAKQIQKESRDKQPKYSLPPAWRAINAGILMRPEGAAVNSQG